LTIEKRAPKAIEIAIVAVVLGILLLLFGPAVASKRIGGQDDKATSALLLAVEHADRYVAQNKTVAGMVPKFLSEHRSTVWTTDPTQAKAPAIHVGLVGPANRQDGYVISTKSTSGVVLSYVKTMDGAVSRCKGTTAPTSAGPCGGSYAETW
jgi:Tfp pilus assembly protein PilE